MFEDHELIDDNLRNWNTDSKNRVLFRQRPEKVALFSNPEKSLPGTKMEPGSKHYEQTRRDQNFLPGRVAYSDL